MNSRDFPWILSNVSCATILAAVSITHLTALAAAITCFLVGFLSTIPAYMEAAPSLFQLLTVLFVAMTFLHVAIYLFDAYTEGVVSPLVCIIYIVAGGLGMVAYMVVFFLMGDLTSPVMPGIIYYLTGAAFPLMIFLFSSLIGGGIIGFALTRLGSDHEGKFKL